MQQYIMIYCVYKYMMNAKISVYNIIKIILLKIINFIIKRKII